ncbi:MAG: TolB protein [Candidatus Azotimanducaceae bacterium]|jgi:TolB protein
MNFKKYSVFCLVTLLVAVATLAPVANAELRIEVTKGVDNAVRVAVVPFSARQFNRQDGRIPIDITEVIDFDLTLSGRFDTLPSDQMLSLPNESKDVYFRDWRILNVEYLVMGYLEPSAEGVRLHFELYNVFKKAVEVSEVIEGSRDELRDMAHYVSDTVFKRLTGIEGAFSTQIMYVTAAGPVENRSFKLNIADADGQRVNVLLESKEPILSATWAPDGKRIAYVSFERDQRPAIYINNLVTGEKQQITNYAGLNGAPSFSPDGKQLAMVLSKDGNPDIYVLNLENRRLRRITRHYGIDTEPTWRPDGQAIVFTSSRGGQPQIYQMTLADLSIERLTFEGDYNAKASLLADGSGLIMVHRRSGIYHIAMLDLKRGRMSILTETALDESPSIAPNGSMLIYATQLAGEGILAAVSIDGGVKFNLPSSDGDVREPAWSPVKRKTFTPISR